MSNVIATLISPALTYTKSTDESSARTTIQLTAPSNQSVKILRWGVFFDEETGDVTPASPLLVEVGKSTTSSGSGGTSQTPKKIEVSAGAVQTSAVVNHTTAGVITDVHDVAYVNSQANYEVIFPMGQEIILDPTEVFAINVTSGTILSTGNLNVISKVWFEE